MKSRPSVCTGEERKTDDIGDLIDIVLNHVCYVNVYEYLHAYASPGISV